MKNIIEKPKCRKAILNILSKDKSISLKDIAYPSYDDMKIYTSNGLKLQARKMLQEMNQ